MARKTKFGNCVYCGGKKNVTRDHVFSKALFVPPYPEDMITVYSCKECNESFSLDEEYFRSIIAAGATFNKEGQKLWHKKVIGSSFKRSSKFQNKIGNKIISIEEFSKAGIYLGQQPTIKFDYETEERMNRVVLKIIKGLYYFHFNKLLKNTVNININFYDEIDNFTKNSLKLLKYNTIGIDKIRYWFDEASDREFSSIWIILFYNSIISLVITNDTNQRSALK